MTRHSRRIRNLLATAVAFAAPLAAASSAAAFKAPPELTFPGGTIHRVHAHVLRVSGAARINALTGVALNPISGLGPGTVDEG
jgi:hypothetical protein